jgi:putative oxidoreductase
LTETVGAIGVILGLFTRFCAAACAIDLGVISFLVMVPRGFGAMEFTLLWGLVMLAIALRGGGPFSIDRLIGREL